MKIKKNDIVIVTTGKDKGRTGKVLAIRTKDSKVTVEGVNTYIKHVKKQGKTAGDRVTRLRPISVSNIAVYNEETKKADRAGYQIAKDGSKTRIYKKTGKPVKTA
jgi:large subunit ribosomal protein L24